MLPPHELKNKSFTKAMRGYNPVEVDEYIDFIIEKYTELYRENDELERKLKATVTRLEEIQGDEDSIRSALIDAKRAANKIKADANERAEAIVRSAKASCNTILADFNEKIEIGRDTLAELQRDTFALKRELFDRYSEHIRYIDKLTEGMDEASIPETSELRREAVNALKTSIAELYAAPAASEEPEPEPEEEEAPVEEAVEIPEEPADATRVFDRAEVEEALSEVSDEAELADEIFAAEPAEEPELAVSREPLNTKKSGGLKNSIKELNKRYKEADEDDDVINTPDSDLGDDVSYLDFVKSVTGKSKEKKDDKKDADFDLLFDEDKKKKK